MAERIAIIGTGLIGGSIGLALAAAKLPDLVLVGYDRSPDAAAEARKRGAIDEVAPELRDAVRDARMVIVATAPLAARQVLRDIAPHLANEAIVTDTLSTKAEVMRWARECLPAHVSYVGGHPMAGKEVSGAGAAEAGLFRGKAYCVVPSPEASESAIRSVLGLVSVLGAEPIFLEAAEHDQYVAAISHLPAVVSTALFTLARGSASWQDLRPLAGTGFRDLTRLASGDPQMHHDICATNGEALIHWIDRMILELRRYRDMIADDPGELYKTFVGAQLQREGYLVGDDRPKRREPIDVPSSGEQMSSFLFGGYVASRYKDYEQRMDELKPRKGSE